MAENTQITIQELQQMKVKISGVRDKILQAEFLYDQHVKSLVNMLSNAYGLMTDEEKAKFKEAVGNSIVFDEENPDTVKNIDESDIDSLKQRVSDTLKQIIDTRNQEIESLYTEVKGKIDEWTTLVNQKDGE